MRITKLFVMSLLAIAATGVAAATAHGEAGVASNATAFTGTDHGVEYRTSLADDQRGIVTQLHGGTFGVTPDHTAVTVAASDGTTVASVPLAYQVADRQLRLDPQLSSDGTALTLRPADSHAAIDTTAFNTAVRDVAAPQLVAAQPQAKEIGLLGAGGGVVVGAIIGAAIGTGIGALLLLVGAIPGFLIGALVGAVIGGAIGLAVVPV